MSRPDDIPRDVWDKALCYVERAIYEPQDVLIIVSRAIQTAKAEAYEEAAKWVVDNGWMSASDAAAIRKLGGE